MTQRRLAAAAILAAGAALATLPAPVQAANARHPYSNVDKRVDKGGDTGDSQVEILNQRSLDAARGQSAAVAPGTMGASPPMTNPAAPANKTP
ncbi:MAG TPA: hypothetical protein VFW75_10830 [Acetobacteraceae bacterium]|nr:hypothetical protein [Acetobacteraceae bacterium]